MFFDEKNYVPNKMDDEVFLTDFPIEIIENAITSQFGTNPFEFRKRDYIQTFFSQYEYSINNCNEEEMETLEEYHDQFIEFILQLFKNKLGIGIPNIEDKIDSEIHEMIHIIYRFFIRNIKRNFINYVYNFITERRDIIDANFSYDKKKDVTTNNFKEEITDEYDLMVLSNLPQITTFILDNVLPAQEFLELCKSEKPCLETSFVLDKFENYEITGNFSEAYVDMIDDDSKIDIIANIRSKILNKYPYRYATFIVSADEEKTTDDEY